MWTIECPSEDTFLGLMVNETQWPGAPDLFDCQFPPRLSCWQNQKPLMWGKKINLFVLVANAFIFLAGEKQ